MINKAVMVRALAAVPDATSVIRFVEGLQQVPVVGNFPVDQSGTTEQTHASIIIPANTFGPGWLRWTLAGAIDYGGGSPDNVTLRFRWGEGGPVMLTGTATMPGGGGTNLPWRGVAEFLCAGPPATNAEITAWFSVLSEPGPAIALLMDTGNFDTTRNTRLCFTAEIASSTGLPHFRTIGSFMETF